MNAGPRIYVEKLLGLFIGKSYFSTYMQNFLCFKFSLLLITYIYPDHPFIFNFFCKFLSTNEQTTGNLWTSVHRCIIDGQQYVAQGIVKQRLQGLKKTTILIVTDIWTLIAIFSNDFTWGEALNCSNFFYLQPAEGWHIIGLYQRLY